MHRKRLANASMAQARMWPHEATRAQWRNADRIDKSLPSPAAATMAGCKSSLRAASPGAQATNFVSPPSASEANERARLFVPTSRRKALPLLWACCPEAATLLYWRVLAATPQAHVSLSLATDVHACNHLLAGRGLDKQICGTSGRCGGIRSGPRKSGAASPPFYRPWGTFGRRIVCVRRECAVPRCGVKLGLGEKASAGIASQSKLQVRQRSFCLSVAAVGRRTPPNPRCNGVKPSASGAAKKLLQAVPPSRSRSVRRQRCPDPTPAAMRPLRR